MKLTDWWTKATPAERNALVAEKIIGIRDFRKDWPCYVSPEDGMLVPWLEEWGEFTEGERDLYTDRSLFFQDSTGFLDAVPDYQGNIADAWQVVEKVVKDHPSWCISVNVHKHTLPEWHCEIGDEDVPEDHWMEFDETAPPAICLAALKALGVEEVE